MGGDRGGVAARGLGAGRRTRLAHGVFVGTATKRYDEQWPQPPALAEIARLGGLPEAGPGAPVSATLLTAQVQPAPRRSFESTRPYAEVRAEIVTLLSDRIPVPDRRAESLLSFLVDMLAGSSVTCSRCPPAMTPCTWSSGTPPVRRCASRWRPRPRSSHRR